MRTKVANQAAGEILRHWYGLLDDVDPGVRRADPTNTLVGTGLIAGGVPVFWCWRAD